MKGFRKLKIGETGGWSGLRLRVGKSWITREALVKEVRDNLVRVAFGPSFERVEEFDRDQVKVPV